MKDRLISPGLLAFAAAAGPFVLVLRVWWVHTYVDPRPELDFLAIPFIFFFLGLCLIITFFGVRSIIGTQNRVDGSVVFAGSVLSGAMFLIPASFQILTLTEGLVLRGLILSSSLGVMEGLKGIYWERSWKAGAALPGLAAYSRWAMIGGLVQLSVAPWFNPQLLTLLGSFVVPVSGALVYKSKGNRRLIGFTIIAGALLAGGSVLYTKLSYNLGITIWEILGLAGAILSLIAGLKILTWKTTASEVGR
ncbi:MAG TPA: hypothetical protein VFE96_04920 [Candidatus Bathyarchaeia archaeon]|nr:hypothetical protein [Candidatus Bathyarchaeia archaeon]